MLICLDEYIERIRHTKSTASLAAIASISAHETTPLHALSTAVLMVSTTSKPLAEFKFAPANFSPSVPSRRTDASHPYTMKKVKKRRRFEVRMTPDSRVERNIYINSHNSSYYD